MGFLDSMGAFAHDSDIYVESSLSPLQIESTPSISTYSQGQCTTRSILYHYSTQSYPMPNPSFTLMSLSEHDNTQEKT